MHRACKIPNMLTNTRCSCDPERSLNDPAIFRTDDHAAAVHQQMPVLREEHVSTMAEFKQPVLECAGTTRGLASP